MITKFHTLKFGILVIITLVAWLVIYFSARQYWKSVPERTIKSDYVKVPINNTLMVMGIVCPLLIALASYLYVNLPAADYSFVLASIAVFTVTLIVAIWETFCLLNKATADDNIKLSWANDSSILTGMGILYSSLIVGVIYLILFFLLDLPIAPAAQPQATANTGVALTKPRPQIGQSRSDILLALGAPSKPGSPDTLEYQGTAVDLELQFDSAGTLKKIIEQRH
jgi:hypothetical protein